jgi:hypothetical protein
MTWMIVAALAVLGFLGIWPLSQYLGQISFTCLLAAIVIATIQTISGHRAA